MTKTMFRILPTCCLVLALVFLVKVSAAQVEAGGLDFYTGANTPGVADGALMISNTGVTGTNLCAMIYVFTSDQQMTECCGCVESPNNLNTLSVNKDLTSNPLTGVLPTSGTIEVVSSAVNGSPCDPTKLDVSTFVYDGVATQSQWPLPEPDKPGGPIVADIKIVANNIWARRVAGLCSFIKVLGSGSGICTCGTGG